MLVFFAVKAEAAPLRSLIKARADVHVVVTGMGRHNAAQGARAAMEKFRPKSVFTCGFAGGLNLDLAVGTVVFAEDAEPSLARKLAGLGARPARFHCAERVASSVATKKTLRATTGADVVEMESGVIRALCQAQGIPCATVRVISDAAGEDLPLDFNEFLTPDQKFNYFKLAMTLARSPGRIPALMRFQRETQQAAAALARVLHAAIGP